MAMQTAAIWFCVSFYLYICFGRAEQLVACGDAFFHPSKYTCFDGDFLCPVLDGEAFLRCGPACYSTKMYSCTAGELVFPPTSTAKTAATSTAFPTQICTESSTIQHISDPPYENYFYSDCHSASQVVVTSPVADSNLTIIGPRLLVAWPAGNSGVVAFFRPQNGINGTLSIELVNKTAPLQPLKGVHRSPNANSLSGDPQFGVSALIDFNATAVLSVAILGSIRTIRDFTEGPSLLHPVIQNAIDVAAVGSNGAILSRPWLDNVTTTQMSFIPVDGGSITFINGSMEFAAGTYNFTASLDYPQLRQLSVQQVLGNQSQALIMQNPDLTTSLSFLSYSEKLLAGAWRFLTYFGRDSMISLLLLQPVLSEGEGGAVEAAISAVLERLNRTSGVVCHEETIGDYATYVNLENNVSSTAPSCTYQMIDTNYYLAPVMENYFLKTAIGQARTSAFFATVATQNFGNQGLTYGELALINAEMVMNNSAAFAQTGGQTEENLMHLEQDQLVGQWRDSTYGIGGGRIPYDVNTALVPAALRSIAALSGADFFPQHPDWYDLASTYAQVWEDETLQFFQVTVPRSEAVELVETYATNAGFGFPSHSEDITSDVVYYGLALDGNDNQSTVKVMNTDDCFRLFLLNTTNDAQLTSFLNQTATNLLAPFPVGLSTPLGMLVANPAYGGAAVYAANFTNNAYHGTVVWSWPMAMLGAGLQRQLARCADDTSPPSFCSDADVHARVRAAYNHLWDVIEANVAHTSNEVWSWVYNDEDGFTFEAFGALPPPPGLSPTESDIRQLWSLTFLAVTRDSALR